MSLICLNLICINYYNTAVKLQSVVTYHVLEQDTEYTVSYTIHQYYQESSVYLLTLVIL